MEKELECYLENIPLSYLMEKELECCLENISLLLNGEGTRVLP
jgi:hypothetical protein